MPQSDESRIDRIIDIARGVAPAGAREKEHREITRIPVAAPVALVLFEPSGEKTPPTVLTGKNISSGGLCAVAPHELSVGGRGAVLISKSDGESVILGARIIYANPLGRHGFECGLEFELQPSAVSIEDFQDIHGNLPQLGPAHAA